MDAEILIWMTVFLGGYALVLGLLFRRGFGRKRSGTNEGPPS